MNWYRGKVHSKPLMQQLESCYKESACERNLKIFLAVTPSDVI